MSSATCDAVQERLVALSIDGRTGVGASVSSASSPEAGDPRMNDEDAADANTWTDIDSKPPAKCKDDPANGKPVQTIQLPPEVVAIVLLHADFSEIPNVALVSKDWRSAIKSGEDEHYLYLLRRHKAVLSKFSDKVLEVDGGISPAASTGTDTATAVGLNANVGGDGKQIVANRGDNTNADDDDDDDRPKPSPKWKMIFRRALFIMKMAHNSRLRLNMLDGPNNRTTIPEPRPKSSYSFSTNIRVLTNDPNQGTDFNIAPDAVSGSDFDSDGCLPVKISRNHLCPIPTSKLSKGFMWISLRHSQSRNVPPVIFRGSYTSVDEIKFKKKYKWKDMELPNGDLLVMGRRLCISTRNYVESHANGGMVKIRFRFDMESLPVGNGTAEKEMFQDLSQLEVLRVMESILFVNGPRVFIERAKTDSKTSPAAASAASTSASLGRHSQGTTTTTVNTTNSLLPPSSFANTEAAVARTAAAFEQLSLDLAENRESLAMYRQRVPSALERERRRRLFSSRRGRFQTTQGSSGPNFLGPETAAAGATSAGAAGPFVGPAVPPAADSQQEQIFRFGRSTASPFGGSPSSAGDSPQQQHPFRFESDVAPTVPTGAAASSGDAQQQQQSLRIGSGTAAPVVGAVGAAASSAGEPQQRQPFRFGIGSAAPSLQASTEAARRFVDSRRSRARSSTGINDSNTTDDGPSEIEVDDATARGE